MVDRVLDVRYVEAAEEVVRRAAHWPAGKELRVFMGVDTRELVAEIALALEASHELHELIEGGAGGDDG